VALSFKLQVALSEFQLQALAVRRFEKSRPNRAMDLDRGVQDSVSRVVEWGVD